MTRKIKDYISPVSLVLLMSFLGTACDPGSGSDDQSDYKQVVKEFYRGVAAIQTGSDIGAKDMFLNAADLAPEESSIWVNLSIIAFRQGDFEESRTFIDRAKETSPSSAAVARISALLLKAQGLFDEAESELEHALNLDPNDIKALYALYEIRRQNDDSSSAELLTRLSGLLPLNQVVEIESVKQAIEDGDPDRIDGELHILAQMGATWSEQANQLFSQLDQSIEQSEQQALISSLRNVLLREPAFRKDIRELQDPPELVSDLLADFITLPRPSQGPDSLDSELAYTLENIGQAESDDVSLGLFYYGNPIQPRLLEYNNDAPRFISDEQDLSIASFQHFANLDANHDYLMDIATLSASGLSIYHQDSLGTFNKSASLAGNFTGVWAVDFDLEGDMDLLLSNSNSSMIYRNNGDGSYTETTLMRNAPSVADFLWYDYDNDGDPDPIILDRASRLHCYSNERSGLYFSVDCPAAQIESMAAADLNGNGEVELIYRSLGSSSIQSSEWIDGEWASRTLFESANPSSKLFVADLDNNGGLDIITVGEASSSYMLMDQDRTYSGVATEVDLQVANVSDQNGDGYLDLLGRGPEGWVMASGAGSKGYHWQKLKFKSADAKGDQRINSFAIGGLTEVRTVLSYQKHIIDSPIIHLGLGAKDQLDVARLIWPNGDVQAEFDLASDQLIETRQRLKGSCPWLFSWNGEEMTFVTDFIWRSPLGLRINAQETAGIMATEDRVRISGDQLREKGGYYDLRITADLWESHFFDYLSLLAVDHPDTTEIFVDESFVFPPPDSTIYHTRKLRPVVAAWDMYGKDVLDQLVSKDARYFESVPLGQYQGIAENHFVEFELESNANNDLLLAYGWVRPTDSSVNVAIGQGLSSKPEGVHLEARDENGTWIRIIPNLGFPSGKHKTMLIPLEKSWTQSYDRFRLRTNMEIYWDQLATVSRYDLSTVALSRQKIASADLIYRGFSEVTEKNRFSPELPNYDRIEASEPIWRDLVGFYTRFGDVVELILGTDDRYVIMNAGDELRLRFKAGDKISGSKRDFVFIGDGWVKDGDFNTVASTTLAPLPTHSSSEYINRSNGLESDPVFQANSADWQRFHTRFISPDRFRNNLVVK